MARDRRSLPQARLVRACVIVIAALIALSGSRRGLAQTLAPPTVVVDLDTVDPRVRIDRIEGGRAVGTVCWAPCGLPLDVRGFYAIAGEGIPATTPFTLSPPPGRVTMAVRPGSHAKRWAAIALLVTGAVGMVAGYALAPHPLTAEEMTKRESPVPALIGLGGVAAGVVGVVLLFSAPTRVTTSTGKSFSGW